MTDLYVVPAGGNSNVAATYSLTDGGVPGILTPASGDTVYCTALSGNFVAVGTLTCDRFICTGYTNTMSGSGTISLLGDTFLLVAGMTYTATGTITFTGANAIGDVTLTRAGKTTNQSYTFNGAGKVFKLADAHNIGTGSLTVTTGAFDSQAFDITCGQFTSQVSNVRVIDLGGSSLFLGSSITITSPTLTFTPPTAIKITRFNASLTSTILFACGVHLPLVQISMAPSNTFSGMTISDINGAPSVGELAYVDAPNANFVSNTILLASNLALDKCSFPESTTLVSSVAGTQRTITTTTGEISGDGVMLRDIVIASPTGCYFTNSIDLGNNGGDLVFNNFGAPTHDIIGVTYDDAGAPLPSVTVIAYKDDAGESKEAGRVTSDAVTGAYTIPVAGTGPFQIMGVKESAPRGDAMTNITAV